MIFYAVGERKLSDFESGRSRLLKPTDSTADTTDYIMDALSPGVMVQGQILTTKRWMHFRARWQTSINGRIEWISRTMSIILGLGTQ